MLTSSMWGTGHELGGPTYKYCAQLMLRIQLGMNLYAGAGLNLQLAFSEAVGTFDYGLRSLHTEADFFDQW